MNDNNDLDFDFEHYNICISCRHMFIIKSLIDDYCENVSSLKEVRDYCDFLINGGISNDFCKKERP